jgi:hypothetical protein
MVGFFLAILEIELRASGMLGKCCSTGVLQGWECPHCLEGRASTEVIQNGSVLENVSFLFAYFITYSYQYRLTGLCFIL